MKKVNSTNWTSRVLQFIVGLVKRSQNRLALITLNLEPTLKLSISTIGNGTIGKCTKEKGNGAYHCKLPNVVTITDHGIAR